MTGERKAELEQVLARMRETLQAFYYSAIQIQCHPFIELTGFMNEYIQICGRALDRGIDFHCTVGCPAGLAEDPLAVQ